MSSLPSDEVAEDYKGSLEDLMTNDRYQISNLTLIAKENIEHAEAISRVLQNHINRVCHFGRYQVPYIPGHDQTDPFIGTSRTETTRLVRFGFDSEKCRLTIHNILRSQSPSDVHVCLLPSGHQCSP